MGITDTFDFSSKTYKAHLKDYDDRQLRKKHHQKVMLFESHCFGAGAGIGAATFTFGVTGVTAAYNLRQARVLWRQLECIEEALRNRGCEVPRARWRDMIGGTALGVLTLGIGHAIPGVADSLAGHGVQTVAGQTSGQAAAAMAPIAHHSVDAAQGVQEGIKATLHNQYDALSGKAAEYVAVPVLCDEGGKMITNTTGQGVGIILTKTGEVAACGAAANGVAAKAWNKVNGSEAKAKK